MEKFFCKSCDIVAENKTLRAAQRACEHCDAPSMEQLRKLGELVESFIAVTAAYNQSPFDRVSIRNYDKVKTKLKKILAERPFFREGL